MAIRTKRCNKCKKIKALSEFYPTKKYGKFGVVAQCKDCHSEQRKKKYRQLHPECTGKDYGKLIGHCKTCGKSFKVVKRFTNNDIKRGLRKFNECVSCAKKRYAAYNYKRTKRFMDFKRDYIIKHGGKCCICGYNDLSVMAVFDFHHTDPSKKEFELSTFIYRSSLKTDLTEWKHEIDKCVIVCSNCHRKIHSSF